MPETIEVRESQAQVYVERLYCNKDEVALEFTGKTFPVQPQKYEYQCPICKRKQVSTVQYPQIVYKEKKK